MVSLSRYFRNCEWHCSRKQFGRFSFLLRPTQSPPENELRWIGHTHFIEQMERLDENPKYFLKNRVSVLKSFARSFDLPVCLPNNRKRAHHELSHLTLVDISEIRGQALLMILAHVIAPKRDPFQQNWKQFESIALKIYIFWGSDQS